MKHFCPGSTTQFLVFMIAAENEAENHIREGDGNFNDIRLDRMCMIIFVDPVNIYPNVSPIMDSIKKTVDSYFSVICRENNCQWFILALAIKMFRSDR